MNIYLVCMLLLVACILSCGPAGAAEPLPPGTPVLGADPLGSFTLSGKDADTELVEILGQPFTKAIRARVRVRPETSYSTQITAPTAAPVKKGDVLHARFHLRALEAADETAEGVTEFVFERIGAPWTKSSTHTARAGAEWKTFDVPFRAREDYGPGQAHVCMRLGFRVQVIEIGGFELTNFGTQVDIKKLPVTIPTYRGHEPDAPWRLEAEERIDTHRKADLTVRVVDARGRRVRGADVKVGMKRHAYGFGSCVNSHYLQDGKETADKKRYREEIRRLFNRTVLENNLKWWGWENGREKAIATVEWLRSSGIEVRGHCLVWPSWRHTPKDMQARQSDEAYLRKRCIDHIADEAGAMKGKLVDWDVMNEPFSNHDLMDVLGPGAMVDWFRKAKETDPDVNVYINDYGILSGGGGNSVHRDHYEKTIRFLIDRGAPLDGIGMQGHFGSNVTAPEDLWRILDRYAEFGLPIQVTEFDMKTGIEEFEAAYTRDFLTAMFAHRATVGVLMWGFWDGRHWKQNAPIFRKDWSVKPSGEAWIDLVFKRWWTEEEGRTDRRGEFEVRGFLGDYEIEAERRGRTGSTEFTLPKGGGTAEVRIE